MSEKFHRDLWAFFRLDSETGDEGICGLGSAIGYIPAVTSEETNVPLMKKLIERSYPKDTIKITLVKFTGGEVLEEIEPK